MKKKKDQKKFPMIEKIKRKIFFKNSKKKPIPVPICFPPSFPPSFSFFFIFSSFFFIFFFIFYSFNGFRFFLNIFLNVGNINRLATHLQFFYSSFCFRHYDPQYYV